MSNRDDMQEAHHQQQLEQQQLEEIVGYECPFCGTVYSLESSNAEGGDIVCCGEIGHCTPYTLEIENEQQRYH